MRFADRYELALNGNSCFRKVGYQISAPREGSFVPDIYGEQSIKSDIAFTELSNSVVGGHDVANTGCRN